MKEKIKKITLDQVFKLSFVFAVLVISSSLFYYYVIFLPQKEKARLEQEHKEYVAKRRIECFEVYERERDRYKRSSVVSNFYNEKKDVCEISYKNAAYNEAICEEKLKEKGYEEKLKEYEEKLKEYEEGILSVRPLNLADLAKRLITECNKYFTKEF